MLLLHGGPGLTDYMDMLCDELTGYRLVGFQQRGIPPSTVNGPFTVDQAVADATAVLDAANETTAIAVGHSWGGHLALQLGLADADRITGIVVVDGLGVVGDGGSSELATELQARLSPADRARCAEVSRSDPSDDAAASEMLRLLWPGYFANPAEAPHPADLRVSPACNQALTSDAMRHLSDGFAERLESNTVPTVFIAGERSPMPTSVAQEAARACGASQLITVPDAGHLPWVEQPGSIRSAVARVDSSTA